MYIGIHFCYKFTEMCITSLLLKKITHLTVIAAERVLSLHKSIKSYLESHLSYEWLYGLRWEYDVLSSEWDAITLDIPISTFADEKAWNEWTCTAQLSLSSYTQSQELQGLHWASISVLVGSKSSVQHTNAVRMLWPANYAAQTQEEKGERGNSTLI